MVRGAVRTHTLRMDLHSFCQPLCPVHKLINEGGSLDKFPFEPISKHRTRVGFTDATTTPSPPGQATTPSPPV
ncbi:hypothetical protein MJO28_004820 [Puccinia striiformis f. sp. tritici]|uniref:Uncharacterized protein n=1 Tax=Puccinia striiformis f. sp. tritici TaxID=168172 RepID=A0ACC0EJG3_9BASI|nr:hypothetical protein MJO28_004820 [Puccinia striiformis f. sp. tritici]KAI7959840.1 hypothetical protein MJO29_004908 [Puccinia striiformis f. sp. tritici]